MKILDIPKSGKCANIVAFPSRYGQCVRSYVVPVNRKTPARDKSRGAFGSVSQMWGGRLSQPQRDRWDVAGPKVMSHPRLGQSGPLTGQQHFEGINCVRACVGLGPVWEPPVRAMFGLSPVRELVIENDGDGVRMYLRFVGPAAEDIMVFGQAPCSAGRSKRRNVVYLGLLPAGAEGLVEITGMYKGRHGEPRAGVKVFIVTCQEKEGWKGFEHEASEIVPEGPARPDRGAKGEEMEGQALGEGENGLKPLMYKGSTRGAQGSGARVVGVGQGGDGGETGKEEGRMKNEEGGGGGKTGGDAPV